MRGTLNDVKGINHSLLRIQLTSLPSTGLKFPQKNINSDSFHNNPLHNRLQKQPELSKG